MEFHSISKEEAIARLKTDSKLGLSSNEAEKRLSDYGKNIITEKKRTSLIRRFLAQFSDFMIITLLVSAAISAALSYLTGENDLTDPIIIIAIVIFNAVIGVIQESRAENAISALKKLTDPKALCIRDGKKVKISAEDIVPGDILCLSSGDMIAADARLISASSFFVNESSLTGESIPEEKNPSAVLPQDAHLPDRVNSVYASSIVTGGRATAVVFATGMNTEVGRLAGIMDSEEALETPLQKKLSKLGKSLALGALLCCFFVFAAGIIKRYDPFFMFMTSVSLAVAAIPEGLPAIVTVMLAMGVSSMAKKKAVIRNLPAVETLGSATIICSDKTGTLTKNEMTVKDVCGAGHESAVLAALCSDSDGKSGSGTDAAIVSFYEGDLNLLKEKYPRVTDIPFSSEKKFMATVNKIDGGYVTIVKGAFDVVLSKSAMVYENGVSVPLSGEKRNKLLKECEKAASLGLRVISVAAKRSGASPDTAGLSYIGSFYLYDPLRPEAKKAVKTCIVAGIEVAMITGDHKDTAIFIAKELGIDKGGVLTGREISSMTQDELKERVKRVRVFARVLPEHKVRIVKAYQSLGHIVAMTGDGVNDAPALKSADIGCAMGKSGTDAARQASDMVLTDDNFATIVSAVREGRIIYKNIKKAAHFLISSNIGEILLMLLGILSGLGAPLLPIQLLWVNLITDSLPAIALGMDRTDDSVMSNRPTNPKESIFSGGVFADILLEGCLIGAVSLAAYCFGRFSIGGGETAARTMAFCTLSISQLIHAFDVRSEKSVFLAKNHNPWLFLAFFSGLFLQCAVCVFPSLATVFSTTPLGIHEILAVALFSLVPFLVSELQKLFVNMCRLTKKKK